MNITKELDQELQGRIEKMLCMWATIQSLVSLKTQFSVLREKPGEVRLEKSLKDKQGVWGDGKQDSGFRRSACSLEEENASLGSRTKDKKWDLVA